MKEIGVGIIGFGFMGKAHTYAYKTMPLYYANLPFKVKLIGICNRTLAVAQRAREELDFEFATDNADELFARPDIDLINICTPNASHKDLIIKALKADKHVYCDKPLAASYDEAKEVLEYLEDSKSITQVAFQNRFLPVVLRAKELLEEGRIGRILSFRSCYLHSGSVDPNKQISWRFDKAIGGGGVLYDLGSHVLDLIYYLLGEYSSIMAKMETAYRQRPDRSGNMVDIAAEDAAYMIASMRNGATGTIEASKIATGANDELTVEIHGDKGALKFNLMDPNWLEYYDNTLPDEPLGGTKGFTRIECIQRYRKPGGGFPSPKQAIGWLRGHVHSLYNFVSSVYEGRQTSPSFRDGAYIQYVMDKAYESDSKGQWIKLD